MCHNLLSNGRPCCNHAARDNWLDRWVRAGGRHRYPCPQLASRAWRDVCVVLSLFVDVCMRAHAYWYAVGCEAPMQLCHGSCGCHCRRQNRPTTIVWHRRLHSGDCVPITCASRWQLWSAMFLLLSQQLSLPCTLLQPEQQAQAKPAESSKLHTRVAHHPRCVVLHAIT